VNGSKTRVIRVFPPGKSIRKCEQVGDAKLLAQVLISSSRRDNGEGTEEGKRQISRYVLPGRRANKLDRSFEGTKKENEDFKILFAKLKELGIGEVSQINEDIKKEILTAAGKHFS